MNSFAPEVVRPAAGQPLEVLVLAVAVVVAGRRHWILLNFYRDLAEPCIIAVWPPDVSGQLGGEAGVL